MRRSEHYQNLDAVRGIAAQLVVVVHAFILAGALKDALPALTGWTGRLAVLVFFCLSGFAIATTIQRGFVRTGGFDLLGYAIRRIARIYPPYLVTILAAAAIAIARVRGVDFAALYQQHAPFNVSVTSWLRALSFTFLQPANDALPATNIAIWSLRLEVILYVIAACAALSLVGKSRMRRIVWGAFGCLALLLLIGAFALGATAAALFGFGALAALLRDRFRPPLFVGFTCFLFAALPPFLMPVLSSDSPIGFACQGLSGSLIGVWLISLAQVPPTPGFVGRALTATGAWSYTLYILHAPTLLAVRAILDATVGSYDGSVLRRITIICGYFVAANFVAYGVACLVERPIWFAGRIEQVLRAFAFAKPLRRAKQDRKRSCASKMLEKHSDSI